MSIRTKLNEQKPFISRRRLPREISRARRGHRSTRRGRETRPTVAVMSGVDVDAMSVGQLKQYLRDAGADTTGCLEKVRERRRSIDGRASSSPPPPSVRRRPRRAVVAPLTVAPSALLPLRPSPRSHRRWTSRGSRRECARPARARAARRAHPPRRLARPRTAITTRTRGDRRRRRSRRSSCLESCA